MEFDLYRSRNSFASRDTDKFLFHREILSPLDRKVTVWDSHSQITREMLMFGSNNYLGFANDSTIKAKVVEAIHQFGVGTAGPTVLNGSSHLQHYLEERLAHFLGMEKTVIFPSGFMAMLGWLTALLTDNSVLLYDEQSHVSLVDAVKLGKKKAIPFDARKPEKLRQKLAQFRSASVNREIFVAVQGVCSINGDVAPIPEIAEFCEAFGGQLVIDDAHGVGVLGDGRGTAAHFGMVKRIKILVGSFSKTFAVTGGFVASDKRTIETLKGLARPYLYTASLPPSVLAAVVAGLDLIEGGFERVDNLNRNTQRLKSHLHRSGIRFVDTPSAIIPVFPPSSDSIDEMNMKLNSAGLFVHSINPPSVPPGGERFRLSVMASHTNGDIDEAAEILQKCLS